MHHFSKIAIAVLIALASTGARASNRTLVAVFDFEFVDTSLEGATNGPRADEQARLAWLSHELRDRLAKSGPFEVVDITPVAARVRDVNLQACGGCDAGFAGKLGAKLAITGWVQKVSNLILNLNIVVRDADSGRVIFGKSVDMRGNTDESWSRSLDWLVRNYLLAPGEGIL